MSKSDKPRKGSKPSVVSLRDRPQHSPKMSSVKAAGEMGQNGGGGVSSPAQQCWRFSLVNVTKAIQLTGAGAPVLGKVDGSILSVHTFGGDRLGEARPARAAQILKAIGDERPRLSGTVLSKKGIEITVKLCRR